MPYTILVVEDNQITQKMMLVTLRTEGFRVIGAADGKTALGHVVTENLDLILQDLILPDMDGIQLARQIREIPAGRDVPIIALSGLASKLEQAQAAGAGFASMLFKPVDTQRLIAEIRSILPEQESQPVKADSRRILLVDDDPLQLKLHRLQLEERGFLVRTAADAVQALIAARDETPDAIVSDLVMPGMDGMDLCRSVRSDPGLSHVPFILTTASGSSVEEEEVKLARGIGANAFVPRSPDLDEVFRALSQSLASDAPRPPKAPPAPVPDLTEEKAKITARVMRELEHHAYLNQSLSRELATKTAQLGIMTAIADVLSRSADLESMLQELLARTLDAAGVSIGAIYLGQGAGKLRLACQVGYPESAANRLHDFFGRAELLSDVLATGNPLQVRSETLGDLGNWFGMGKGDAGYFTLVPLVVSGDRLGVLFIASAQRQLGRDWLRMATAVGIQIGQAVALARSLSRMRESEQRFRAVSANAPVGIFECDASGRCRFANPQCQHLLAHAMTWIDAVHPDERQIVAARWREAVESGRGFSIECRFGSAEGHVRWAAVRVVPPPDQGQGYFGTIADVTDRKVAEEALRQNLELLHAVTEGTSDLIVAKDLTGRYLMVNSAAAAVFGRKPGEITGSTDVQLFPATAAHWIRSTDYDVALTGETKVYEESFAGADGTVRPYLSSKGVLRARDRTVTGTFSISRDMTDHKALESQLRQAQKMEAVGRLAGGVAHDFNNMLTAIMSYAELLHSDLPDEGTLHDNLDEIRQAARRAAGLTRQLLAFSRQQLLEPRVLDPNDIVMGLEKMLRRLIGEDIDLVTKLGSPIGRVRADPGQIEQAILNLVINARDAMPSGGRLAIETADVDLDDRYTSDHGIDGIGPYVMIAITDSGQGMDKATQARIFDPFFTTKEQGKGTGLGLSTVYGIVKQSGGFVWVYSEPGQGSTFKIYLPRIDAPVEAPVVAAPVRTTTGRETVLVVEDEEALRRVAERILQRDGYTVLVAGSGDEALALAEASKRPIDIIATDVVMPGLGGRELVSRLLAIHPDSKVLFMSGYTDDAVLRHGVPEPGTAFLQKPFSGLSLTRKIREILDG
jgi:PAS domain S-box-containing protein